MKTSYRAELFQTITLNYDENGTLCEDLQSEEEICQDEDIAHTLNQTLWPDHCVMDTQGAELSTQLEVKDSDLFIKKGFNCEVRD